MLKKIAVASLVAGGLLAGAFTATSAIAARGSGMSGGGMGGMHAAAPHFSPGGGAMHEPRGAFNHPSPEHPGPGAHGRVYGWHGGGNYGRIHHRRGFGVILGSGYYGDYYYGDYGYGCEWLHERAVSTGSRYWWRRYEDCVEG